MAASPMAVCLFLVVLVLCFLETEAGSFCYRRINYYTVRYEYCTYGCCGSSYNEYCCAATVGIIVGGVIGSIVVLSVIIAIICCCIKKQGHSGRVVRPIPTNTNPANVTVVYSGTAGVTGVGHPHPNAMATAPSMPPQPPAYKQVDNPPPAYNYTDPAYPPGANPSASGASPFASGANPPASGSQSTAGANPPASGTPFTAGANPPASGANAPSQVYGPPPTNFPHIVNQPPPPGFNTGAKAAPQ